MKPVVFHRTFKKQYKKLTQRQQEVFDERFRLFCSTPNDSRLNNRGLRGTYEGHRSINVTGDIRAIYRQTENGVIFTAIGTHAELYSK